MQWHHDISQRRILAIIFVTLIGLPEGFGAWLCSLLGKTRLIISVNPWFRKPYVAARYAMGGLQDPCLSSFTFTIIMMLMFQLTTMEIGY